MGSCIVSGIISLVSVLMSVCLCAIVIKSPGCPLAQSSLLEIDQSKDFFTQVTVYCISHAQPTIMKLHKQAHLTMAQYREGKWPVTEPRDEAATDVTKFIGRSNFAPPTRQREVVPSISNDQGEVFLPTGTHPTMFEYVKQFEKQVDRSESTQQTNVIQGGTSTFAQEQGMLSSNVFGMTKDMQYSGSVPLTIIQRDAITTNDLEASGGVQASLATQASESINWPSNGFYEDLSSDLTSLQGYANNGISQPLVHDNLYLAQGTDPFQPSEQLSQDQVWEQLLSVLIPSDMTEDPTSM
ncbi:hypothetical protein CPB86DRAFT_541207 [Serendipita vermifera]|nr:hypothetical protein CPB86DRAFT_541207 [Serendipita vermifera]